MARRKGGALIGVAGVALLGAVVYGATASGGSTVKSADAGGGAVPGPSGAPAPYAIHTLGGIGTAAQDPGGGGGGTGEPGSVGPPDIQGAQGAGSAQGSENSSDTLYLSGVNLIDPNPSAVTSGQNTFPSLGTSGAPIFDPLLGTSATGCATTPDSVGYYAIPLTIETVGWNGAPRAHIRISGGGPITLTLYQQSPNGGCQAVTSGSGTISGGVANVTLGSRRFQFTKGYTPALVIKAPSGSHTISTDSNNPSSITFPGLYGV